MNIGSCLTSLQLLLAEPNPDDPLMPEIAEQLRYNRERVTTLVRLQSWDQQNICHCFSSMTQRKSGPPNMHLRKRKKTTRVRGWKLVEPPTFSTYLCIRRWLVVTKLNSLKVFQNYKFNADGMLDMCVWVKMISFLTEISELVFLCQNRCVSFELWRMCCIIDISMQHISGRKPEYL